MRLDHVQIPMPPGQEDAADVFYCDLLGLPRVPKPESLADRGGRWYSAGGTQIHLGVDDECAPSPKSHICFVVLDYDRLLQRLNEAGCSTAVVSRLVEVSRFYCWDPFGNRIEIQDGRTGNTYEK